MSDTIQRIGILTGGGDCPGLNAVIRAAVKTAINEYGWEVLGILFFLPYALALGGFGDAQLLAGSVRNLLVVTGGNILGGTVLVAGVYWLAYLRPGAGTMQAQ